MASTLNLFTTQLYRARLPSTAAQTLNKELSAACVELQAQDRAGRDWCRKNHYPGYTSTLR